MFKFIRLVLFVALVCSINIYCKKEKDAEPQPETPKGIAYKELNATIGVNKNSSLKIDINDDGIHDFELFRDMYSTDMDTLRGFFIRSLGAHEMIQLMLSDNPLFESKNLMSYSGNEVISESLTSEYLWSTKNGMLVIRHDPNGNFIGRWGDGNAKMMGIALSLNNKSYYGWIKLQYDRESNSMTVLNYAYNRAADAWLRAGQKE